VKKIFNHFLGLTTVLLILLAACSTKDENPTEPPITETTMTKEQITGSLIVVDQSTLQPEDLKVVTFAEESSVNGDGTFTVKSSDANKNQVIFICSQQILIFNQQKRGGQWTCMTGSLN